MKNIYMILLLLITGSIYAQEKELDIKKLAELVNSDEEFNQYFEDLSWVQSADSLNIYFETVTSNEATIYAIKNIGNPSVFLLTNKSKVALGWEKQIKKFAKFYITDVSPDKQIHQYKFNNATYGWISEKDAETGLYSMFVMKPQQLSTVQTQNALAYPKGGMDAFRRNFSRRFRFDKKFGGYKGEIKFTVTPEGKITNIATLPYNKSVHEQAKEILNDSEWIPAIENGKPVKYQFNWKIQIQTYE